MPADREPRCNGRQRGACRGDLERGGPTALGSPDLSINTNTVRQITVFIFTIDYVFRLCTVHTVPASILLAREVAIDIDGHLIDVSRVLKGGAWRKTWYFATSFMGVVDLLSILPFYVNIIIWYPRYSFRTSDPGLYDLTRVFRILRTLKLLRYDIQKRH